MLNKEYFITLSMSQMLFCIHLLKANLNVIIHLKIMFFFITTEIFVVVVVFVQQLRSDRATA